MAEPTHKPCFFKVIVKPEQFRQLFIPTQFVLDYGNLLSNGQSLLRVPVSSMSWDVKLIKKRREAYFAQGWAEFCRQFSLAICDFVVFKYMGDNNFHVMIFSPRATEIDYWSYLEGLMDGVVILSSSLSESSDDQQETTVDGIEPLRLSSDDNVPEQRTENAASTSVGTPRRGRPITRSTQHPGRKGKERAETAAGGGFLNIPPAALNHWFLTGPKTFQIKIQRTYTTKSCTVHVPSSHASAYLVDNTMNGGVVKLTFGRGEGHSRTRVPNSVWSVCYRVEKKKGYVQFSQGWYEFVVDNSIREHDVCHFELTDVRSKVYIVSILPKEKGKGRIQRNKPKDQPATAAPANGPSKKKRRYNKKWEKDLETKYPYFSIQMTSSYVNPATYMHIPAHHSKVHMHHGEVGQVVVLRLKKGEKAWDVKCSNDKLTKNPRLGAGWATFVKENGIKEGDVCIFELVDPQVMLYEVTICRL